MSARNRTSWWRLVNWKLVALVGLPAWAVVGGGVYHAHANRPAATPAPPEPPEHPWHNIPIGPGHPLYCGEDPAEKFVGPPAPPADPVGEGRSGGGFGPGLWFNVTMVAGLPAAQPGMPPHHPLLPDPDHLWAKVVEAQVRRANEMVQQAKLANLPVNAELEFEPKPVEKKKAGPPAEIGGCKTFETYLAFRKSPAEAFKLAKRDDKLVLMLHLAGNIEDDGFT
jgi:hypothetical protein